ncbi:hypothetical protein PRK78_006876 [Emydomyces testavorans]|uniref:RlpA-like protein double-psi beta-barrel domain-containing protein n=1 Tax=Emydomyces testavorans TaxID=2070801 RepID=A0AAF0DQ59_9EURO|nr:hypothetical protein PRK78_006876 [Emydomyces testavorans]
MAPPRERSPVSPLSQTPSLPSFKHFEAGNASTTKVTTKHEGVPVVMSSSGVPRRKPLPESAVVGYAQHDERVVGASNGEKGLVSRLSLQEKLRFNGDKKRQRIFFGGIVAAVVVVLVALIIGLSVGLTRKNRTSNLPLPLNNGGPYSGDLTYYEPALGACGITSTGSQNICAVSRILYDAASTGSDPNQNPLCGLKIRLKKGDRSVDVTVVDRCVGCKPTDIDVSMGVFQKLASIEQGRVNVEWAWLNKNPVSIPQ